MSNTYDQDYDKINKHNQASNKADLIKFAAGGIGACGAELLKFPAKFGVDIYQAGEAVNNLIQTYMFHGKGAFQAIVYASLINMAVSEYKSNKGFKVGDKSKAIKKDFSVAAGLATMVTGLAWEGYSMVVGNYHGVQNATYDWKDVLFYGIGVAVFVAGSKIMDKINKNKFFNGQNDPFQDKKETPDNGKAFSGP